MSGIDAQQPTAGLAPFRDAGKAMAYWLTVTLLGAYAAAGVVILPFAQSPGPVIPGLTTFFATGVFVTELSTGFLLFVRFRDSRSLAQIVLACAYLFSALMQVPYLLTFPDAVLRGASVLGSAQSTAWIFIAWITGFVVLTLAAVVLEAWFGDLQVPRSGTATSTAAACVVAGVAVVAMLAIMHPEWLPVLVEAHGWSGIDVWISYANMGMLAASLAIIMLVVRARSELFLWLALALAAMLFSHVVATFGGARYTIGWSVSRVSWVLSGCALFLYFMGQFVRQQSLLGRSRAALEQAVNARTSDLIDMVGQRDLLLREVHHRVKNNFQVVNSLISYQAGHAASSETRAALHSLHSRVYALGLVHQRLMQSDNLSTFDADVFLTDLCTNVATLAAAEARRIEIEIEADPLQTDLDFAGPLALLVTELVSAAFEHFAESQTGAIRVSLRRDGESRLILRVADDAEPEADLIDAVHSDPQTRILRALLAQLAATLETTRDKEKGTIIRVVMPFSERKSVPAGTSTIS